jgi:hydroxyisourate hydrolase
MTSLSTHVLDTELGAPASGLAIALYRDEHRLAAAVTGADGRVADLGGGALQAGVYRLVFDVATYLEAHGRAAPFLRRVTIEFELDARQPHYHVPLLMTAYACTSYRGS